MKNWLNKWPDKITEEWKKFITPNNSSAGKMYGMVKTHKNDNPVRMITSGCNTAIEKEFDMDSTQCIVEALEICLTCSNSKFNDQNFLQTDGTAQWPHMSCSYADITMAKYDFLANQFHLKPKIWKRFKDDIFTLWEHGVDTLPFFFDYLNGVDTTGKIKFTKEIASENGLQFLDLKLKLAEDKIRVDVHAKPTNSFSYTSPNTCYPKNNICNIPKDIALRLRRICDDDEHLINVLLNIRTTL